MVAWLTYYLLPSETTQIMDDITYKWYSTKGTIVIIIYIQLKVTTFWFIFGAK